MKSEIQEFQATASTTVDCVVYSSIHHVEVSPAESDRYDRVIVNTLIKDMAGSARLDSSAEGGHSWKVIVIHDLDKLSREAQSGLRRTMEKYMHNCRIIFNCESLSRVLPPLKSRCVQMRVPAPKKEEIASTLKLITGYEDFRVDDTLVQRIAGNCDRNMRKAIMILQTLKSQHNNMSAQLKMPVPGYEEVVETICNMALQEQTPKQLRLIRSKFYELLVKGITAEVVLTLMAKQLLRIVDNSAKLQVIEHAVQCDYRCMQGQKDIVHLEAFTAIVMMIMRRHMS